jgi:hypothetical protein
MDLKKVLITIFFAGGFVSCGKDEKTATTAPDDTGVACAHGDLGCGTVVDSKEDKLSIPLDKSASGDKYVVMPFSVGNIATVDGAGAEKILFTVPIGKANLKGNPTKKIFESEISPVAADGVDQQFLARNAGDLARTIYGHWSPRSGRDGQAPGFWNLVKAYDRVNETMLAEGGLNQLQQTESLESKFLKELDSLPTRLTSSSPQSLAGDCPAQDADILLPGGENVEATEVVAGVDYCIVYQDGPLVETDPVTGAPLPGTDPVKVAATKVEIENSIKATLAAYKKVIYKDEFAETANGFTFKPIIVIINPKKADYGMPGAFLGFLGVFTSKETDETKMPMLYLASDLTKIQGLANDAKGKASFHATIAHELQHAISFYYRAMKAKTVAERSLETVFVDEGLAHTMEDVFGYGTEEFTDYAGTFLSFFGAGLYPFLGGSALPPDEYAGDNFNVFRGSAQAFLYYLASQKGGVTFKDGVVSGGDGLKYYADITKSGKLGAKNLKETFAHATWSWTETVGNFLSAIVLDNSSVAKVEEKHQVKEPFKEVTDLQGVKNKTFGMRFNNFAAIKDATAKDASNPYTAFDAAELELRHYQTRPGLITVTDATKPVEIGTPGDGSAAAVVRIK